MPMKDVRVLAKLLLETSGDPREDFKTFQNVLPLDNKLGSRYNEVRDMFIEGDIRAYQQNNIWYHIIKKLPKYKQPQTLPQKPLFRLDKIYKTLREEEQEFIRAERDRVQVEIVKQEERGDNTNRNLEEYYESRSWDDDLTEIQNYEFRDPQIMVWTDYIKSTKRIERYHFVNLDSGHKDN